LTDTQELDLSVVLACYNEEPILEANASEIIRTLDNTRYSYEIIFVDDGSADRTREIIDSLIERHPDHRLRRIFHAGNMGRGATVADGFRVARGGVAGYIDVDLEVHCRYIPAMVEAMRDGGDIAVAQRIYKFNWRSLDRYIMSKGYIWLVRRALKVPLTDTETGFKFFRRETVMPVIEEIEDTGWFWDTEFMVRAHRRGLKIKEIPCLFIRRYERPSSVRGMRDSIMYFRKLHDFKKTFAKEDT